MLANFVDRMGEPNAPLGVGTELLELALAPAAGVDLRLDDPQGPGSCLAASTASSTLIAAWPAGTGTPNFASSSFA